MFKLTKLKNGLRVVNVPLKGTQAITVLILVRAGSRYESEKENGLAHFLEHMFFKGGKRYPNTLAVAEAIDNVGGIFNAYTDKEVVGYWVKIASSHLSRALDVLSDMLLGAKFEPKEIEKEKGVIIEEINLYEDNPLFSINDLFEETIFGSSPLGRKIVGKKENIKIFRQENFLNYLKKFYYPSNMIIALAGEIKNQNNIIKLIEKYFIFSPLKSKQLKKIRFSRTKRRNFSLHYKKTDQAHLVLGFWGLPFADQSLPILLVLDAILGGSMSSRLFISVREKRGLAYSIRSQVESYTDTGYWSVYAGTGINQIDKTIKIIIKEIKRIKEQSIDLKEIKKGKELIKGRTILAMEDSEYLANYFALKALLAPRKIDTPNQFFKKIDSVTINQIKNLAQKIFTPSNLNLTIMGPYKNKGLFNKILKLSF